MKLFSSKAGPVKSRLNPGPL